MRTYVSVTCQGCGNTFDVPPYRAKTAKYCSMECRKQRVTEPCEWCSEPVERWKSKAEQSAHAFCNHNCYGEWRKTLVGKKAPRWNGGPAVLTCEQCGETYTRKHKDVKKFGSRFCSRICMDRWKSENLTGENSPNWQGGAIDDKYYGPEWEIIREEIRKRDNYTCQRCGLHQDDHPTALHVHHIVPLRQFLPDRADCAHTPGNLTTLYSPCHRKTHNEI